LELNYNVTHKPAHGSGCWGSALRLLIELWFLLFFDSKNKQNEGLWRPNPYKGN
jgi:hypothetical protein